MRYLHMCKICGVCQTLYISSPSFFKLYNYQLKKNKVKVIRSTLGGSSSARSQT